MKRTRGQKGREKGRVLDEKYSEQIRSLLADMPIKRELLIEYLHKIQDFYHCISKPHIRALARELNIPTAEVFEVATFYHHFDVLEDNQSPPPPLTVRVCESITCEMFGAESLLSELENKIDKNQVRIQKVPCVGRCHDAPVAIVGTHPVARADSAAVTKAIGDKQTDIEVGAYTDFEKYVSEGGYSCFQKCIGGEIKQDEIISTLENSNLRGLGGAGFPVGRKWRILKDQEAPLIAINIDEGEPGTFKDRYYLERDPHRFLEGALIAHWAIAAEDIYIYLRDEYAGCRKILEKEITQLRENAPFSVPEIHLRRGAGAYICGEESAMIESIEGKRGMPRLRPPYVAQVGLFGRPTLEHNMESLHWVRDIIEKGAEWFTSHGRNNRKGLRSFSVSGRVKKPGVHLAPAGISVRELIEEYCEGMLDGHEFYGFFPGGASGGILPASLGDAPLDFDTLQEHGSFIGSAAVIILSHKDSAKAMARNAMHFFQEESCGQCTPCRVGTAKSVRLMLNREWDTDLLEELAVVMEDASICGLGQAAPNPMRTAIRYFPEEFK